MIVETTVSARLSRAFEWAKEPLLQLAIVLGCVLVYFGTRGITEGSEAAAIAHGHDLLRLEAALGLRIEDDLQEVVLRSGWLTTVSNWIYIWGHWPVIALVMIWLHHGDRRRYLLLRNAMIASGAIGLVIFMTYPVAPPRLLPDGFVDTVTEHSHSYRVLQPPALVNRFAAMPSLHAGWNLLVGIVVFNACRRGVVRVLAVLSPLLMSYAVVATANHYVLDPIVGWVVVLIGLAASHAWLTARGRASRVRSSHAARPEFGDQSEVVDDQTVDAPVAQLPSPPGFGHAPREEGATSAQLPNGSLREQAFAHRRATTPSVAQAAQGKELQAVSRRSYGQRRRG